MTIETTIKKVLGGIAERWDLDPAELRRVTAPDDFKRFWPVFEIIRGLFDNPAEELVFISQPLDELDGHSVQDALADDALLARLVTLLEGLAGRR